MCSVELVQCSLRPTRWLLRRLVGSHAVIELIELNYSLKSELSSVFSPREPTDCKPYKWWHHPCTLITIPGLRFVLQGSICRGPLRSVKRKTNWPNIWWNVFIKIYILWFSEILTSSLFTDSGLDPSTICGLALFSSWWGAGDGTRYRAVVRGYGTGVWGTRVWPCLSSYFKDVEVNYWQYCLKIAWVFACLVGIGLNIFGWIYILFIYLISVLMLLWSCRWLIILFDGPFIEREKHEIQ